jgi:hypothetical protein
MLAQATGNPRFAWLTTAWTHMTHHSSDSGEAITFPHIVYFAFACDTCIQMAFFSRDSQGGVSKLSRFGLSGFCEFITLYSDLQLGWSLKKTYRSPQELSNGVSHSTCTHRGWVDSRLLVVRSQIANLTSGLSFIHNLCCRCLNGSCKAILDIYTLKPFQRYKEHFKGRCFDPYNQTLNLWESRGTPKSPFQECECHPHTPSKWGCDINWPTFSKKWLLECATKNIKKFNIAFCTNRIS